MLLDLKSVASCCSQSACGVFARALLYCMQCVPVLLPCVEGHVLLRVEHLCMCTRWILLCAGAHMAAQARLSVAGCFVLAGFPGVCCTSVSEFLPRVLALEGGKVF